MSNSSYKNKNSAYINFSREQWAKLAHHLNFDIDEKEIKPLLGFNETLDSQELNDYYTPLVRLLACLYENHIQKHLSMQKFLNHRTKVAPFIIGISGSVSVGKSTFSRILKRILELYIVPAKIDLINTDGFLYDLNHLKEHDLLSRKGFPESYNTAALLEFLTNIRSGCNAKSPIYSHITYDIIPNKFIEIQKPNILIIEGLNILQTGDTNNTNFNMFVSDFIDFSIYIDAKTSLLKQWYINRFLTFRQTSFKEKNSYFKKFANLSDEQAIKFASNVWDSINGVNLKENILPSKERASLIVEKGDNHKIKRIRLRK